MDEILNEEPKAEVPAQTEEEQQAQTAETPRPRRRRPAPKKRAAIPIPVFLTHLGEDVKWYYDVRLWSPLILLLLILALVLGGGKKEVIVEKVPETVPAVVQVQETTAPTEPIIPDAVALAKLADSVGAGRTDNAKTIIMWVAINRSEDRANGYGASLQEEINRPNQWQGYDEKVEYSDRTYEIAKSVLRTKETGGLRPLDKDMLWLVLNDNGSITVRNRFTATGNQKWTEKTIE